MEKAIQDYYTDSFAQCYGCGYQNDQGYHLKTVWNGEETLTRFTPKPEHTAIPGYVYGGLIASVIDCHGTGSGSLALARERNIQLAGHNAPRCVTASLKVNYLRPTPLGPELVVSGRIKEVKGRKVIVEAEMKVNGQLTATGEIIVVEVPDNF